MTLEPPVPLTRQEYYNRAFQWVGPAMEELTSADAFYGIMRDAGLYIPRSIAREVWAEHGTAVEWKPLIERLPPEWKIPKRWTPEVEYTRPGKYIARVHITGIHAETGEDFERHPLVALDEQGTMSDILLGGEDITVRYPKDFPGIITSMVYESYYHVKGREW